MGRSFSFECGRCGYRARVSGGADRGVNVQVQTVSCRDCQALHDAVTRVRMPDEQWPGLMRGGLGFRLRPFGPARDSGPPPTFAAALNRLHYRGAPRYRWVRYRLQCPVSGLHRVVPWNDPDKCPKCGGFMEKTVLPFRLWE